MTGTGVSRSRVRQEPPPALATDAEIDEARRKISYNVAQLERYLAGDDSIANVAADLRLLYSVFEVALHYFTVRRLPWRGEKPAVRHWTEHDPEFLDLLRRCLATADRRQKADLCADLARRALAPAGGLWEPGATVIAVATAWGAGDDEPKGALADATDFWRRLVADGARSGISGAAATRDDTQSGAKSSASTRMMTAS